VASVVPNPRAIRAFATEAAFEAWRAPESARRFRGLAKQQLGFLAYRVHHVKTPERRAQLIAELVSALSSGRVPVPARLALAPARTSSPKRRR
jgi:hypothetical protein